jgi:hypothetical protein
MTKGDGHVAQFKVEAKSTQADKMRLDLEWLAKITQESRATGKEPMVSVSFTNAQGVARPHGRWVMLTEDFFVEVLEGLVRAMETP